MNHYNLHKISKKFPQFRFIKNFEHPFQLKLNIRINLIFIYQHICCGTADLFSVLYLIKMINS